MNNRKFRILFCLLLLGCDTAITKNNSTTNYKQFEQIVEANIKIMTDSGNTFSVNSAINLVKVHNSLRLYNFEQKDSVKYYQSMDLFNKQTFGRVLKILHMELSLGMSYYSRSYNLQFGAFPGNKESYFEVDTSVNCSQY